MGRNSLRWMFNCRRWLPSKDDLLIALSCIQEEERNRIFNFYFQKDLKLALIGQLMLRKCVSDCLDIQYEKVRFIRTSKGKPVLPEQLRLTCDGHPFDFNISHDGDYCVLAAASINKIGIDISKVKESNRQSTDEYFKTMERIFSPQEWLFIKGQDSSVNNQSPLHKFHRLWALKESFVKAEAIGIGYELRRIQFDCPTECVPHNRVIRDTSVYHDGSLSSEWVFEESLIDDNHFVSVALWDDASVRDQSTVDSFQFVQFDSLINPNARIDVDEEFWVKFNGKGAGRYD